MLSRLTTWFALGVVVGTLASAQPSQSKWMQKHTHGSPVILVEEGHSLPDFSRAGYGGGGVRLPEAPVRVTLAPQPDGDDGARIQAALDEVGKLPADARGLRGAVVLKAGTYRVAESVALKTGGVVLRGEGEDKTTIVATGKKKRTLIAVGDPRARRALVGKPLNMLGSTRVPAYLDYIEMESLGDLKIGDRILVRRPSTAEWIRELGMDRIKNRPGAKEGDTKQWKAGDFDLEMERTITAIVGRRVTLDAPLMTTFENRFGGGTVSRFTLPRIAECGVEGLRLVSEYAKGKENEDEDHAWTAIEIHAVENAWVREVTMLHFSFGVQTYSHALFTTIQDCRHLDPVSQITGGRRYSFHLNGQYGLVLRCHARNSRHTFVTGARVRGPNVFLDGTAVQAHADSGPHHRWAVGTLYDNISDDNSIRVQDRQWAGSGHGWAGAQQVLWNCTAREFVLQRPPTEQNFAIGCVGKMIKGQWSPDAPMGSIESPGRHVSPRSLYLAQLEARLGKTAVENIAARPGR